MEYSAQVFILKRNLDYHESRTKKIVVVFIRGIIQSTQRFKY